MDADAPPKIGKLIKRARERKRLSQAQAAEALGISRSALNAWENDRAYPRSSIGALEDFYGIRIDEPEPEEQQETPTPEELERLKEHMRDLLGRKGAAPLEEALDAYLRGDPPPSGLGKWGAAGEGGPTAASSPIRSRR